MLHKCEKKILLQTAGFFKLISYLTKKTIKLIKDPDKSKDLHTFANGNTVIFLSQISAVAADCDKHSDDIECAILAGDILFTGSDDGLIKVSDIYALRKLLPLKFHSERGISIPSSSS